MDPEEIVRAFPYCVDFHAQGTGIQANFDNIYRRSDCNDWLEDYQNGKDYLRQRVTIHLLRYRFADVRVAVMFKVIFGGA